MPGWFAIYTVPLGILAGSVAMAYRNDDAMWLVFGAVLAMITGYLARRYFGS